MVAKFKTYKYSISPEVPAQYTELGRNGANALGELNQLMHTAKKAGEVGGSPYYDHVNTGVRIYTQKQYNVITKVEAMEKSFAQSVTFTQHAIERIVERLEQPQCNAENHVRKLLATATYQGETSNKYGVCDNYLHYKSRVNIVVARDSKSVVTVYNAKEQPKSIATITVSRISAAIKRELARMTTQLRREIRKLTEQQAQLNINAAELTLNKIRCKAPHTQALIQTRIDAIITQVEEIAQEVDAKLTQIKNAEREVSEVVGE
ncbi:hypothetical protein 8F11_15 [uncultured Caudovirales phage]|uniref:Uncharacterized protein n=1 Tax=uncultured Caudovirales phage TaxID=2100421 RepID=A0A2H4IZJ0_9CAUD|nr:hypothetical protein 8F11_15 [uncultured Caudovirales phage]